MAAIFSTGKSTPVSLFAHITETSAVSGRIARSNSSRSSLPFFVHAEESRRAPGGRVRFALLPHRAVLDRRGHDVLPRGIELQRGMQRRVIRFRPAARENNFASADSRATPRPAPAPARSLPAPARRSDNRPKDCRSIS